MDERFTDPTSPGSREGSAISEEEDGGAYESVDEFLLRDLLGAKPAGPPSSLTPPRPPVHDYTPVKMEGGEGHIGQEGTPQENVWAPLLLKSSTVSKKRPSVGDSSPHQHPPPFGTSPLSRPVPVPPERVTPPPSPPTPRVAGRDLENTEQRPSLPPKRRKSAPYSEPDTSKWRGSPPKIPAPVQVFSPSLTTAPKDQTSFSPTSTGGCLLLATVTSCSIHWSNFR